MREIVPGLVWIGNARDGRDVTAVLAKEIQAVVDLALEEPPAHFPREVICCRYPLLDGAGNPPAVLRTAMQAIVALIQAKIPTLVVCSGGMSRSPAMMAATLATVNGGSPDEWLKQIALTGHHDVSPALWNDVRQLVRNA